METILIVLLAVAIIGIIFLLTDSLKWKRLYLEADARPAAKPESRPEPKQIKAEKTAPKKTEKSNDKQDKVDKAEKSKQDKELQEAREEIKKLKSKLHDLKGEVKDLKVAEAEAPQPLVNSEGLFELREELAKAKADAAEWKAKAEAKPAKESRKEEKPVVVDVPRNEAPAVASTASITQNDDSLKRIQAQLENVKKDHHKVLDELKNLKDRAKKGGRNADKERRRADDNDRAYRITKSQLDVTLDRVSYLEGKLAAAGIAVEVQEVPVLTPAPRRATAPVVDLRDVVKEEVIAEPETPVAVAEEAPVHTSAPEVAHEEAPAAVEPPAEDDGVAEPIVRRSANEDGGGTIKAKPVSQADLFQAAMVKEEDHGEMQVYTSDDEELEKTSMLGSNTLENVLTAPSVGGDENGEDESGEDSNVDDGWANLE